MWIKKKKGSGELVVVHQRFKHIICLTVGPMLESWWDQRTHFLMWTNF